MNTSVNRSSIIDDIGLILNFKINIDNLTFHFYSKDVLIEQTMLQTLQIFNRFPAWRTKILKKNNVYNIIDEEQCCSVKPNTIRELELASKMIKKSGSSIPTEMTPSAPDAVPISSYVEIGDYDSSINTNDKASGSANNDCIQRVPMAPESHYL